MDWSMVIETLGPPVVALVAAALSWAAVKAAKWFEAQTGVQMEIRRDQLAQRIRRVIENGALAWLNQHGFEISQEGRINQSTPLGPEMKRSLVDSTIAHVQRTHRESLAAAGIDSEQLRSAVDTLVSKVVR